MLDAIVVGLGAMGSAALHHLATRGARVAGVDAHEPPHALGSTHGRSRIIREAYFEHPSYVPLVRRAYRNWANLERDSGMALFTKTGGLMIGRPESGVVTGTLASAAQHGIPVTTLDASEMRRRYPGLEPEDAMLGVLEPNAGVLDPEACVRAHLQLARARGADVRTRARVLRVEAGPSSGVVFMADGQLEARHVILAAGPWTRALAQTLGADLPLVVERQTMHWFKGGAAFDAEHLPVTLIEHAQGRYVYFIPDLGHGVKAAIHYEGAIVDPDRDLRVVADADVRAVRALLARFTPSLDGEPQESAVCLYTNTPDKHFLFDALAGRANVSVISACSGHGFKFASAIGELAAARALGEPLPIDLRHFSAARFA